MSCPGPREPVDAVITWVDGHDPNHQKKLENYLASQGIARPVEAAPTRFNQCGEIDYCIKSILKFAPWIRNLYVITDAQEPKNFKKLQADLPEGKLQLIDHRVIFRGYEHCLPSFNSLSIESLMWRIPELAERFIYFNDDCAIIQPVTPEQFFYHDKLVLRGSWKKQNRQKWRNRIKKIWPFLSKLRFLTDKPNDFRQNLENSAVLTGWQTHYLHHPHAPMPIKKSLLEQFFHNNPQFLTNNIQFQIRNTAQFNPISIAQHLAKMHRQTVLDKKLIALNINPACHTTEKIMKKLKKADKNSNIAFVCIQSLDTADPAMQKLLLTWLDKKITGDNDGLY